MKRFMNTSKIVLTVFLTATTLFGFAQKTLTLEAKPSLKISGTSSLHDWEMTSETATGKAVATYEGTTITEVKALQIEMPVETLKSGKSGMDKNAYKALKTDQFKTVKFDLKSAAKNADGTWNFQGTFTIAGVSKAVVLKVKEGASPTTASFEGTHAFKLTDYKITPPTALMGTVKTGDDVTIRFAVKFK